mgnify:CR=1 FL=1
MKHYGHMVRVLHCTISQSVTGALAEMELTSAQGRIMGYLALSPEPPCAKDIEDRFHLSHPTVSGLLARLEKKEFIEVREDPEDRRRKLVYILPKGQQCNETMYAVIQSGDKKLLEGFTPEEEAQFREYLLRALHNVSPDFDIEKVKKEESRK